MKYDLSYLELELRELLKKLKKHNTYASQLENEIILYKLENDKLKSIINKAIEYITQLEFESEELYDISEIARLELLDILKGSDKE